MIASAAISTIVTKDFFSLAVAMSVYAYLEISIRITVHNAYTSTLNGIECNLDAYAYRLSSKKTVRIPYIYINKYI